MAVLHLLLDRQLTVELGSGELLVAALMLVLASNELVAKILDVLTLRLQTIHKSFIQFICFRWVSTRSRACC